MHDGQVPLHTLRADIDYGFVEARTAMGRIGVKVWIYKGEILPESKVEEEEELVAEAAPAVEEEVTEPVAEAAPVKPAPKRRTRAKSVPKAKVKQSEEMATEPVTEEKTESESFTEQGESGATT